MHSFRFTRGRLVLPSIALLTALLVGGALWLLRDPEPRMRARRSHLAAVVERPAELIEGHLVRVVRLTAASGLTVELTLKRPPDSSGGRRPAVILLGGHHTGRDAVRFVPDTRGTVVAAMSYPYQGEPRPDAIEFLRDIPKIRQAFVDTPPALQLVVDYLHRQADVDTTRIEAVGVSLGGPFVTIAGAMDERISRVWVIHGSGGSYGPLEKSIRRSVPFAPASMAAAALANVIIAGPRLAPERWVHRIAPRPFLMVNAEDDERLPREDVDRLFAAAREPKEIRWHPGAHVRANAEVVRPLVELVLAKVAPE